MPASIGTSLQSTFLGTPVKVVTIHGQELEGEVFCYDAASDSLVLRRRLPGNEVSYKWVRGCSLVIRAVSALGPPSQDAEALPAVDLGGLAERSRRAEGLSQRPGQDAFRLLSATMDCEWEEDVLKVLAPYNVRILAPYAPESCSGGEPWALEKVRAELGSVRGERRGEAASSASQSLGAEEAGSAPQGLPEGTDEAACSGGAGAGASRAAEEGLAVSAGPAGPDGAPDDGEAALPRGAPASPPACDGGGGAASAAGAHGPGAALGEAEEQAVQEAAPPPRQAHEPPAEQDAARAPAPAGEERPGHGGDRAD